MKTWKQIKMECLGLLFSRTDGGNLVSLDNADVRDYVNEMPDAANYALRDLADVARPIIKSVEVIQDGLQNGWVRYDLREIAPNFMRLVPNRIVWEHDGEYGRFTDYQQEGSGVLVFPGRVQGTFRVFYRAYPEEVEAGTPDDQTFELAAEALDLVPIYMASRLYKDDDIAIATDYLNEYQARRDELIRTADDVVDGSYGNFVSVTGWV